MKKMYFKKTLCSFSECDAIGEKEKNKQKKKTVLRVQSGLPSLTERKTEAQICHKQLVTCLAASYWHGQVLNPWMAGLSFFSNVKLPYT